MNVSYSMRRVRSMRFSVSRTLCSLNGTHSPSRLAIWNSSRVVLFLTLLRWTR